MRWLSPNTGQTNEKGRSQVRRSVGPPQHGVDRVLRPPPGESMCRVLSLTYLKPPVRLLLVSRDWRKLCLHSHGHLSRIPKTHVTVFLVVAQRRHVANHPCSVGDLRRVVPLHCPCGTGIVTEASGCTGAVRIPSTGLLAFVQELLWGPDARAVLLWSMLVSSQCALSKCSSPFGLVSRERNLARVCICWLAVIDVMR
jgi:hypothetical protein